MRSVWVLVLSTLLLGTLWSFANSPAEPSDATLRDLEKLINAEWDAAKRRDVDGFLSAYSKDVTGFEQTGPYLAKGLAIVRKIREADFKVSKASTLRNVISNPHLQLYGNTAVLTYSFVGLAREGDGKIFTINAKATRVYVRDGSNWKLVHFHFSD